MEKPGRDADTQTLWAQDAPSLGPQDSDTFVDDTAYDASRSRLATDGLLRPALAYDASTFGLSSAELRAVRGQGNISGVVGGRNNISQRLSGMALATRRSSENIVEASKMVLDS